MHLKEILDVVVETPAELWHKVSLSEGALIPYFRMGQGAANASSNALGNDAEDHHLLAVNIEYPEISIAYGMRLADEVHFDQLHFHDRRVWINAADVLLNGALVHRESILIVDGGRARLPHPSGFFTTVLGVPEVAAGTVPQWGVPDLVADTVTQWQYEFANLVDQMEPATSEFDDYFAQTGFIIVPGHPLDQPTPGG